MAGGYRAMVELREQGAVRAIGAGINETAACQDLAERGDFDCFLLAGRYTLLEQAPLDEFLPLCERRNIALIIGGAYNTGILATGAVEGAYFQYAPAPPEIMERVRRIEAVCARHGVRLPTAALQFPLGHPAVATVIPGTRSPKKSPRTSRFSRRDSRRFLGRAQAGGPAPRRRADALATDHLVGRAGHAGRAFCWKRYQSCAEMPVDRPALSVNLIQDFLWPESDSIPRSCLGMSCSRRKFARVAAPAEADTSVGGTRSKRVAA